jgi:hypothetical protein
MTFFNFGIHFVMCGAFHIWVQEGKNELMPAPGQPGNRSRNHQMPFLFYFCLKVDLFIFTSASFHSSCARVSAHAPSGSPSYSTPPHSLIDSILLPSTTTNPIIVSSRATTTQSQGTIEEKLRFYFKGTVLLYIRSPQIHLRRRLTCCVCVCVFIS